MPDFFCETPAASGITVITYTQLKIHILNINKVDRYNVVFMRPSKKNRFSAKLILSIELIVY